LSIPRTNLEVRIHPIVDTDSPALRELGLFIGENDGKVTTLYEKVAGDAAIFRSGRNAGCQDGGVVQEYSPGHGVVSLLEER
jgi:hypothetical protein